LNQATKVTICVDCQREVYYETRRPKYCLECRKKHRQQYKLEWYKEKIAPRKALEQRLLRDILDNKDLRAKLRLDWDHFVGKGTHYFTDLRRVWIKREGLWRIKSAWDLEGWINGRRKNFKKYFD
jgi:hypothetical protein